MTRRRKTKPGRKRSAVAKDLCTPKYKQRVVELKTRYRRKKKIEEPEQED